MRLERAYELKAKEIAEKHNLSLEQVKSIIESPYSFIREKTKKIVIRDNLSKEEFSQLKTNFNIPCLCKMYASYKIYNYWMGVKYDKKK